MNNQVESTRLTAGRDLDIIVAERLMGWQIETDQIKIKRLSQYLTSDSQGRWWRTPEGGWDINIHHPTHQTLWLPFGWSR